MAAFRKIGTIVEISPECLLHNDYSVLCVVVARVKPDNISEDQWIGNPGRGL